MHGRVTVWLASHACRRCSGALDCSKQHLQAPLLLTISASLCTASLPPLQRLVDRAQTQARFSGEIERLQMARDLVWGRQLNEWQIREASRGQGGERGGGAALQLLAAELDWLGWLPRAGGSPWLNCSPRPLSSPAPPAD